MNQLKSGNLRITMANNNIHGILRTIHGRLGRESRAGHCVYDVSYPPHYRMDSFFCFVTIIKLPLKHGILCNQNETTMELIHGMSWTDPFPLCSSIADLSGLGLPEILNEQACATITQYTAPFIPSAAPNNHYTLPEVSFFYELEATGPSRTFSVARSR